ncbi:BREX-3 system P-loop-containing protein BrxF [Halomonas borealis]|uniref:BREX-3 system P-loop-containing protein BrxF n=1 Tax=Halomonas borealis TaxID=2508710 RepID=UPI00109F5CEC|nr:BREX-3 system P-loop-containing protein BrxF [Halomonas borealis]
MLKYLEQSVEEITALHSKLLLLVGPPGSGKSLLLSKLAATTSTTVVKVGAELGRKLASFPHRQRTLQANAMLRELASAHVTNDLLLLDNIELLFDRSLKLDPLDLLKHHAKAHRVVAVWPGGIRNDRLVYAELGHPEYQEYSLDSLVPFELKKFS